MSKGQFAEFAAAVLRSLPWDLDVPMAQGWIENRAALTKVLREALVPPQELQTVNSALRGELAVSKPARSWHEQDGVIYFSVTSDGRTGPQWIECMEDKDFRVGECAKQVLRSLDFKPTNGVTILIAVLKGVPLSDDHLITEKVRAEADKRKFSKLNAEAACLIRENFMDKDIENMGLEWVVVMHEPINNFDGNPSLLGASRIGGGRWLETEDDNPDDWWYRQGGFAFAVSQV